MKQQHETSLCRFRPVACENASRGCVEVLPYKVNIYYVLGVLIKGFDKMQDINSHQKNCNNRQKTTKHESDVKSPVKRKSVNKPLKTSLKDSTTKVTAESPEIKIEFCDNITLD